MDTTDPDIVFDQDGVCNHYFEYQAAAREHLVPGEPGREKLRALQTSIQRHGRRKKYDCILGLSGGVDSTYLCLIAKEIGLRPLIVHFDNGWNSELAVRNIENTVRRLGYDLYTYVVDWDEFRDLQRSYFAANVVDIEVVTDHGFMSVLYRQALKHRIRYIITGMNIVTEAILPRAWHYNKGDVENIRSIQRAYGSIDPRAFRSYPFLSPIKRTMIDRLLRTRPVAPLNWMDFNYEDVKKRLISELGWRDYGGKHYESVFTRYYQGAILPRKFKFDKRRAHLSTLICSGQISRTQALAELDRPSLSPDQEVIDRRFVLKKLGFSEAEFDKYLERPARSHREFASSRSLFQVFPRLRFLSGVGRRLFPA